MMGRQHASSYRYEHVEPFGRYSFIAVDACPTPGPRRPFNFFGYLDDVSYVCVICSLHLCEHRALLRVVMNVWQIVVLRQVINVVTLCLVKMV